MVVQRLSAASDGDGRRSLVGVEGLQTMMLERIRCGAAEDFDRDGGDVDGSL